MFISVMVVSLANQMAQKEVDCSLIQGFPQGIEGGFMPTLTVWFLQQRNTEGSYAEGPRL